MDKETLRNKNKLLRKNLDIQKASDLIVSKILCFDAFLRAKNVLIFYPLRHEVNLLKLMNIKNKIFYLPKTDKNNLLICPYSDELKMSNFKVMEPCTKPVSNLSVIDIAFVPALAVDKKLNRLGYGKGYYDRLFAHPDFKALKVGVLFKELVVDSIEADNFDVPLDFLITD